MKIILLTFAFMIIIAKSDDVTHLDTSGGTCPVCTHFYHPNNLNQIKEIPYNQNTNNDDWVGSANALWSKWT